MKSTIKKTLSLVLALGLVLTALGCSMAYADSRREFPNTPVAVERPDKQEASTPAAPAKPAAPAVSPSAPPAPAVPAAPAADTITAEQAKALALQVLGLSDAHFTDVERDDGKFELELCDGTREYDVEVVIRTGRVVEVDRDDDPCDRCEWDDDDRDARYDDDWDDRYDDWDDHWDD
ncbi:MAG: hypothetical protein IJE94_06400 [Oscillospiraceae bacterium]|nr:hypothetical protein [Oscillospiraceae bacterium]